MLRVIVVAGLGLVAAGRSDAGAPALEPKLTAARLVEAFLTNEAFADEHYVGKEVELTGTVVRVSRSKYPPTEATGQQYMLELDQGKAGRGEKVDVVLLLFFNEPDRGGLAKLKPGQTVVVRGKCGSRVVWAAQPGKRDKEYSEVHLRGCSLVGGK